MGETFGGRFEQSPKERLQEGVNRLERWIREGSPTVALMDIIIDLDRALADAKERRDFDATEIEGTIARLKNEARIKDDSRAGKGPTKRVIRIESGPERKDNMGELPKN